VSHVSRSESLPVGTATAARMAWGSVVVGVLALAAALRFIQLGHDSLWTDEGFSLRLVRSGAAHFFDETTSADPNPPFYYVLLRG
jgi:hypothetical protein